MHKEKSVCVENSHKKFKHSKGKVFCPVCRADVTHILPVSGNVCYYCKFTEK